MDIQRSMSRRSFLSASLCTAAGLLLPDAVLAMKKESKRLRFYHTHTGRNMEIKYSPGGYRGSVRQALEDFLCDFRTGEKHALDPRLFDSLYAIQNRCAQQASFEIISGYRSPKTNAYLRKNSSGVARKSLHMQGRALDIRIPELPTSTLRDLAMQLHDGGVGYYPASDFIHIDTGHKRSW